MLKEFPASFFHSCVRATVQDCAYRDKYVRVFTETHAYVIRELVSCVTNPTCFSSGFKVTSATSCFELVPTLLFHRHRSCTARCPLQELS